MTWWYAKWGGGGTGSSSPQWGGIMFHKHCLELLVFGANGDQTTFTWFYFIFFYRKCILFYFLHPECSTLSTSPTKCHRSIIIRIGVDGILFDCSLNGLGERNRLKNHSVCNFWVLMAILREAVVGTEQSCSCNMTLYNSQHAYSVVVCDHTFVEWWHEWMSFSTGKNRS